MIGSIIVAVIAIIYCICYAVSRSLCCMREVHGLDYLDLRSYCFASHQLS